MKKMIVKQGQLMVATFSADWEGTYDTILLLLAVKDFDMWTEWKAYKAWEHYKRRVNEWKYDTDFYRSLIKNGFLEQVNCMYADINTTGKDTLKYWSLEDEEKAFE